MIERAHERPVSLDGKTFKVVATASEGVVDDRTLFSFHESDTVVSARYTGGAIRLGFLVGTFSDSRLDFRYVQLDAAGRLDSGFSVCKLEQPVDGPLRLHEHFQWDSREGSGINVLEEIRT
jgi:hypothetical protein